MADNSEEILYTLRELVKVMRTGSVAGSGWNKDPKKTHTQTFAQQRQASPENIASKQRLEKAMKEGTKALKDAFKSQENYSRDSKLAGVMFNAAINKLSLKAFDQLPERISKLTEGIGFEFKSTAEIQRTLREGTVENIESAKKFKVQLDKLTIGADDYNAKLDQIQRQWTQDVRLLDKPTEDLEKDFAKFGKAVNTETQAIEDAATKTGMMSWAAKAAGAALLYLGGQAIETTKAAAKFGVDIIPLGADMKFLGMSAEELGQVQNQNIQGIKNAGLSFGDFDNKLISGAWDLLAFTGSLGEGAKLTAGLFHSFRMLSNQSGPQLDASMKQASNIFKEMHDTVGETVEQFQALTQSIESNQDIQVNMYRLNQAQRAQAEVQILQQSQQLRDMGLMDDEAKSVIATFAELGAEGPKERRKKAAQLMAVGGALGMGSEARQLASMIQAGDTSSPEFVKLAGAMQKRAQQQYANVKGTAGEYAQYELTNKIPQLLGQRGPITALATRQGMATSAADQANAVQHATGIAQPGATQSVWDQKSRDTLITSVVGTEDVLKGVFGSGLVGIISTVASFIIGKGMLSKMLGGAGKLATLGEGAVGVGGAATVGGVAAAAGTVATLAAVGLASYGITTLLTDTIPKMLGAKKGLGEAIGGKIADWVGPKITDSKTPALHKDIIVANMAKDRAALQKGNLDAEQQKATLDALDNLTRELAVMNKKDPTKAVEELHKTLKQHHQEDKQQTQEQTDAIKKTKAVVMKPSSSTPVGQTS